MYNPTCRLQEINYYYYILAVFQNYNIWEWNMAICKCSRSCTYTLFLPPKGWNWAYFRSTGSFFWDIGRFSKLPYLVKYGEIACVHFTAALSEVQAVFQNCHFGAWNLAISKMSRSYTYTLFLPQGVEIEFIFALRATVSEIRADFPNCCMKLGNWKKFQKLHIYSLSPLRVEIELIFAQYLSLR